MRNNPKQKPIYAFVDSQNLNVSTQRLGWKVDWKKFRQWLSDTYGVEKAYLFIGYVPEFEEMYQQLHEAGYLIVLKPTFDMTRVRPEAGEQKTESKDSKDPNAKKQEERPTKGNVDADLVLWAMKELPNYDKAILVSGDGDFYALVEYLVEQKKLLKLLAPNAFYSGLYNRFDEYVVRLDQHRAELAYRDFRRKPKKT
ncbi:NYN domain-containing protein [Candidatus Saccharibacteria bacterium]|nr:NYN domain-containing protein [Candidatus Saccharibacteria bacterium]